MRKKEFGKKHMISGRRNQREIGFMRVLTWLWAAQ